MSPIALVATSAVDTNERSAEQPRPEGDFNARWAAWQTRGRMHDQVIRRRLLMLASAGIVAAALVSLLLLR
jgi:hypothetical protein